MIAALVATRSRPDQLDRLLECAQKTGTKHVTWFVGLDDDDEQNYPRRPDVEYVVTPRAQLAVKTNELAALTWNDFPILAQFDDDQWPRTYGWDTKVIAAMEQLDGGLVYTDDGWMGEQTPVCPFWPAAYAREIGWLYHPDLIHLFADNTLLELSKALQRRTYLPNVLIEHVHPIIGKSEWDDSYRESNSGDTWAHDEAVFKAYAASEQFQAHVAALSDTRWR